MRSRASPEDGAMANVGAFLQRMEGNRAPVRSSLYIGWSEHFFGSVHIENPQYILRGLRGESFRPKMLDILAAMLQGGDPTYSMSKML